MAWGSILRHPVTRKGILFTFLVAALVAYSAFAFREVSNHPRYRLRRLSVDLVEGSGSLERPMVVDLERVLRDVRGASLFDPNLVPYVGAQIRELPWVDVLVGVEKVYPDRLRPVLRVRRPVAALERRKGEGVLVDREGAALPFGYYPASLGGEVPVLTGVRPGEGSAEEVREGVDIVLELVEAGLTERCTVREVDLSNVGGREDPRESEIVIRTATGVTIEWGRSRRSPRALDEPSPAVKMDSLKETLRSFPGLEGIARVKLQFWKPYVEPLGFETLSDS